MNAEIGFVERLVWFWSNHFCVSADVVHNMAGGYEREAIRPHVLGRFGDMLLAAESHPAMLIYLDNFRSIGPMSVAGLLNKTGLNENLAREILELHTLGVRTVYTQDDVYRFAKTITGWTMRPMATDPEHGNEFLFNPRLHEPGPQTILGKTYPEGGVEQGRAVLADLARHPATAAHVALKLARHFSSDEPPPALVERLSKRFLDTDGDLKETRQGAGRGAGNLGRAAAEAEAAERMADRGLARDRRRAGGAPHLRLAWAISASGSGGRPRRRASPTCSRPGSTGCRSGSTSPTASPSWWRRGSSRPRCVETALGPLASARNAAGRSRAPKAASRRSRWR